MKFYKSITGFRVEGTANVIACKDWVHIYLQIYEEVFLKSDSGTESGEKIVSPPHNTVSRKNSS
jgi:hypothetical protein